MVDTAFLSEGSLVKHFYYDRVLHEINSAQFNTDYIQAGALAKVLNEFIPHFGAYVVDAVVENKL